MSNTNNNTNLTAAAFANASASDVLARLCPMGDAIDGVSVDQDWGDGVTRIEFCDGSALLVSDEVVVENSGKSFFRITANGTPMGIYAGDTEADALDALARDAGYRDHADACEAVGTQGGEVVTECFDRVCGGEGEDYDEGTVDSVDGDDVTVRWDSGVTTTQPAELLRAM